MTKPGTGDDDTRRGDVQPRQSRWRVTGVTPKSERIPSAAAQAPSPKCPGAGTDRSHRPQRNQTLSRNKTSQVKKTYHLSNISSLGLQMALPSCCTLSLMERRFSPGVNCINICHRSGISAYNDEKYVQRMRGALSIASLPVKRN